MNHDELHSIASSEDLVFTVENYDALKKLKDILAWEACKGQGVKVVAVLFDNFNI